jgi:hypothetical protein
MNEDQDEQRAEKFRLLYRFIKVCQRWMDEGCWSLVLAQRAQREGSPLISCARPTPTPE